MPNKNGAKKGRDVSPDHFSSAAKKKAPESNQIVVRLYSGHHLIASDLDTGKSDPVAFAWLGYPGAEPNWDDFANEESGILLTKTCPSTLDPIWNEDLTFPIELDHIEALDDLRCLVFVKDEDQNEDGSLSYDTLGCLELSIKDALKETKVLQHNLVGKATTYVLKKVAGMPHKTDYGSIKLSISLILTEEKTKPLFEYLGSGIDSIDKFSAQFHKYLVTDGKSLEVNNGDMTSRSNQSGLTSSMESLRSARRGRPPSATGIVSRKAGSVLVPPKRPQTAPALMSLPEEREGATDDDAASLPPPAFDEIGRSPGGDKNAGYDWENDSVPGYNDTARTEMLVSDLEKLEGKIQDNLATDREPDDVSILMQPPSGGDEGANTFDDEILVLPKDTVLKNATTSSATAAKDSNVNKDVASSGRQKPDGIAKEADQSVSGGPRAAAFPPAQSELQLDLSAVRPAEAKPWKPATATTEPVKAPETNTAASVGSLAVVEKAPVVEQREDDSAYVQGSAAVAARTLKELAYQRSQVKGVLTELTRVMKMGFVRVSRRIDGLDLHVKTLTQSSSEAGPEGDSESLLPPRSRPRLARTSNVNNSSTVGRGGGGSSRGGATRGGGSGFGGGMGMPGIPDSGGGLSIKQLMRSKKQELANGGPPSSGGVDMVLKDPLTGQIYSTAAKEAERYKNITDDSADVLGLGGSVSLGDDAVQFCEQKNLAAAFTTVLDRSIPGEFGALLSRVSWLGDPDLLDNIPHTTLNKIFERIALTLNSLCPAPSMVSTIPSALATQGMAPHTEKVRRSYHAMDSSEKDRVTDKCILWVMALSRLQEKEAAAGDSGESGGFRRQGDMNMVGRSGSSLLNAHVVYDLRRALQPLAQECSKRGLLASLLREKIR